MCGHFKPKVDNWAELYELLNMFGPEPPQRDLFEKSEIRPTNNYPVIRVRLHRRYEVTGARVQVQPRSGATQNLGRAFPINPLVINQRETPHPLPCQFALSLELSPLQLEVLEEARDGGDLPLRLTLDGLGSDDHVLEASIPQSSFDITIPDSNWVKALDGVGAQQAILFEIPLTQRENGLAHPGTKHLKKAHQAFIEGDWPTARAECRKVAENLEGSKLGKVKTEFMANAGQMAKRDRTTFLLVAIQNYCHMATHSKENTDPVEFSRDDAQLILSMTATYANWSARSVEG